MRRCSPGPGRVPIPRQVLLQVWDLDLTPLDWGMGGKPGGQIARSPSQIGLFHWSQWSGGSASILRGTLGGGWTLRDPTQATRANPLARCAPFQSYLNCFSPSPKLLRQFETATADFADASFRAASNGKVAKTHVVLPVSSPINEPHRTALLSGVDKPFCPACSQEIKHRAETTESAKRSGSDAWIRHQDNPDSSRLGQAAYYQQRPTSVLQWPRCSENFSSSRRRVSSLVAERD